MVDIGIDNETGQFKFRVCGIVRQGNHILTIKMKKSEGYCFPGGHVGFNETTDSAIIREMKEELGIDVLIEKLICVNENIYNLTHDRIAHEIGYYYTLNSTTEYDLRDFIIDEIDNGKLKSHNFHWINIYEEDPEMLRPEFVLKILKENTNHTLVNTTDYR
ncbi:MAG: NUDIX domain-containing protein [Clostridia bacterium]|nr:NUDIX domain-containing protein [Clostridia bacterium]